MSSGHQPLISVVIPAYNRAVPIVQAIKSVQDQTYPNWEIVVSDDGSQDNTREVVEQLSQKDHRIRLITRASNAGAQAARNAGIKAAQGEWIAFLDSDDQYLPDSLAKRITIAQTEHVQVVHSDAYIQLPDQPLQHYRVPNWKGEIYTKILQKEGPMFPAILVTKAALERIGYLDEGIKSYQEWDTCIRLAKYYAFGFVSEPTFIYDYRTPNAISRDCIRAGIGYEQSLTKHWKEIIRYVGFGILSDHYAVAAEWYRKGGDEPNTIRCSRLSIVYKFLSPSKMITKIKHILKRPHGPQ